MRGGRAVDNRDTPIRRLGIGEFGVSCRATPTVRTCPQTSLRPIPHVRESCVRRQAFRHQRRHRWSQCAHAERCGR
jgi:hypothetical protein